MSTLEERLREENISDFNNGTGNWDINYEKLSSFIKSEIEQAKLEARDEVRRDYINWVIAYSNNRPYEGKTPFARWKDEAEAEYMKSWD